MSNNAFAFKQFTIRQDKCAMKVGTDAVLLGAWAKTYGVRHALDIGTGTGVIALMLAQKCGASIDAIDVDEAAVEQAIENSKESSWADRVHIHHTSLQDFAKVQDAKYDLVVSNPPFFSDDIPSAEPSRTRARHTVLLSFHDLISGVKKLLDPKGKFCVILPSREGKEVQGIAEESGLHLTRLTHVKTTPDKAAKRMLMQFAFAAKPNVSESTLIIEKDNLNAQHYTDEYRELTKEYYLYF